MKKIHILSFFFMIGLYFPVPSSYGAALSNKSIMLSATAGTITSYTPINSAVLTSFTQLVHQGNAYYHQKYYSTAIVYYKKALEKYQQHYNNEKRILLALVYDKLGMGYLAIQAYEQSYVYLYGALTIRKKCLLRATSHEKLYKHISTLIGKSCYHLGCLYLAMDKPKKAIEALNASLKTAWQLEAASMKVQEYIFIACQRMVYHQEQKETIPFTLPHQYKFFSLTSQKKHPPLAPATYTKAISFVATQCGNNESALGSNMHRESGGNAFFCAVCQKKFSRHHSLNVHMRVHTGEKPFQCTVCQKKFSQQQHLNVHMRIHTGEKPFGCPVCGKKFAVKQNMKTHLHVHTKENNFFCPFCSKKFSRKYSMQEHVKCIHKKKILLSTVHST